MARKHSTALFFLVTALYWSSMYVYVPILSVYAENLGASMGLVGAVVGAYGFSQLVLRIPLGVWSDRVGVRKPFILAGLVIAGVGALGLGLASDPIWLVAWRAMTGVGAAAWVAFTVFFSGHFPPEKVTRAMSHVVFVAGVSQVVSTYAGGLIAEAWGWRVPFYAAAALGLMGAMAAVPLDEKPVTVRREMALRDIYRIGTVPLLLAVSVACMLSQWAHWGTSAGFTLVYAARLGAGRADLGMLTTVMQLAYMPAALLSDRLSTRFGPRRAALAGMGIQGAGALMVPLVGTVPMLAVSQVLSGAGRGLSYPLLMALSIQAVPVRDRATAMGVFQAVYALGMFAGPTSTGILGDAFGLQSIFYVAGMACVVGAMVVAARVPSRP